MANAYSLESPVHLVGTLSSMNSLARLCETAVGPCGRYEAFERGGIRRVPVDHGQSGSQQRDARATDGATTPVGVQAFGIRDATHPDEWHLYPLVRKYRQRAE